MIPAASTATSARRRSGSRAGSPRHRTTAEKNPRAVQSNYFNQSLIDKREASHLWRRCSDLVEASNAAGHIAFQCIKVHGIDAELSVLVGGRGRPSQWWLRVIYSGALVLTGNRHGLLPTDGGALHG